MLQLKQRLIRPPKDTEVAEQGFKHRQPGVRTHQCSGHPSIALLRSEGRSVTEERLLEETVSLEVENISNKSKLYLTSDGGR